MIRLGLIGYPLGHSLSPKIHAAAFKACGLEGGYSLFPIHPEDKQGLKNLLGRVRSEEITGLNVTIPHKQNVIELMDELTPTAQAIGAVNTIYYRNGKIIGENTDAPGFLSDLKKFIGNRKSALILGAGGSARAVVYALTGDAWQVSIFARRIEQARQLASSMSVPGLDIINSLAKTDLSNITLIVNTTPVGMFPNTDQSPWPEDLSFPQSVIYDLVYNPRETKLVKDARTQGLPAANGFGMLVNQAALAFEIWTGHNPPREFLFNAGDQTAN